MARKSAKSRPKPVIKKISCRVQSVYDGDTITVTWRQSSWFGLHTTTRLLKVRLAYIDTPELRGHEQGARSAKKTLHTLIAGKRVILEYEECANGRWQTGKFGRMLAVVHLKRLIRPNLNVNAYLLRQGLARLYRNADNITPHHRRRFLRAERSARRQQVGLWQPATPSFSWRRALRFWSLFGLGIIIGVLLGLLLLPAP